MKPYLAVIMDLFRAALCSRVLWILLMMITCFLLALAPLALERVAYQTNDSSTGNALQIRYAGYDFGMPIQVHGQAPERLIAFAVAWFWTTS